MHVLDWSIVAGLLIFMTIAAIYTRKYNKGVADFLAANRCAKRYLLSISEGMAGMGAITIAGYFEMYYHAGFSIAWWSTIMIMVTVVISLSGWVIYRYRETRALTLAQFFEIRYSKKFRVFMGILMWLTGIINFGLFPAVGARLFMYLSGIPEFMLVAGTEVSVYALLTFLLIFIALVFTFLGGQITVLVTDFIQGVFCAIGFVLIILVVFRLYDWSTIMEAAAMAPENASRINPFKTSKAEDFNVWYYLIAGFSVFYHYMAWQGNQGYFASGLNAHETRMGRVLGTWRSLTYTTFIMLLPIIVFTVMKHPDYSSIAASITESLSGVENETLRGQLVVPVALRKILPVGILGILFASLMSAFISTHDTYLHSWGSIFIQDVILPFRKKPFTPKQHVLLLRISIFFVAVFIYIFSLVFRQTDYILMFIAITGTIYLGGAGAAIVGGLYWKRGTTLAAWFAMITGAAIAILGIILQQLPDTANYVNDTTPNIICHFCNFLSYLRGVNGMVMKFYAIICALSVYLIISLSQKNIFNLERMLHRGKYAIEEEGSKISKPITGWRAMIGMGSEFTFWDRVIYLSTIGWNFLWLGIFIIGTVLNLSFDVSDKVWGNYWYWYIVISIILGVVITVWFVIGGISNIKDMFAKLRVAERNVLDDGMVVNHHNLAEDSNANFKKTNG